jgi:hypothetical protein
MPPSAVVTRRRRNRRPRVQHQAARVRATCVDDDGACIDTRVDACIDDTGIDRGAAHQRGRSAIARCGSAGGEVEIVVVGLLAASRVAHRRLGVRGRGRHGRRLEARSRRAVAEQVDHRVGRRARRRGQRRAVRHEGDLAGDRAQVRGADDVGSRRSDATRTTSQLRFTSDAYCTDHPLMVTGVVPRLKISM